MSRTVYTMEMKNLFREHKKNGKTLSWITEAMNISINTIKEWSSRLHKGESIEDKRSTNGKQKKFSDESLKTYVAENIHATLKDIGDAFSVSEVAIWKRLKNMHYSYKKKRWHIENETNEEE